MPQQIWVINSSQGGNDNADLIGCKIKQTDTGFDFTDPDNDVLSSTTATSPTFTFESIALDDHNWTVTVETLTGGPGNNQASGSWSNDDPTIQGVEDGTWVAQAGGGAEKGDDADDEIASKAAL